MNLAQATTWRWRLIMISMVASVTAAAVWITVRGQDLGQLQVALGQMALWPFAFSLGGLCLGTLARAVRFHVLMRRAGSRLTYALEMILIGYLFTTLLPLRTGELVRVGYFTRRSGAPLLTVTSATVAERGMDLLALALLGAVFLSGAVGRQIEGLPFPPWLIGALAGAGVVGAVAVGLVVRRREERRGPGESKLARLFDDLLGGLRALGSLRDMATAMAMSLGLWLMVSLSMKIAFLSVGQSVPLADAVVVMLGTCFAIALPSTPGFVGTYHLGFVAGALLVGIPRELSIPVAVLFHLVIQVPFLPVGGIILFTGGRRALARPLKQATAEIEP